MFLRFRPVRILLVPLAFPLFCSCAVFGAQNPTATQSGPQDAKFKIAGTIVNALDGTPLARARVSISDTSDHVGPFWIFTSENGRFEFPSLNAGKYSLEGAKRGFIPAGYDQHEQYSTAIVTGVGFDTENLVLRLMPLAFLGGKIFDEAGDPVRHAAIALYRESHQGGMVRIGRAGNNLTDDQGSYEFPFLAPGNYFVSVSARPWYAVHPVSYSSEGAANSATSVAPSLDVAYPTTYYNGATEAEAATPIQIKGGDRLQIDVYLNPVPAVHLVFRVPDPQQGFNTPSIGTRVFESMEFVQHEGMQSVSPGVFELTGIPAGKYVVLQHDPKTGQLTQSTEINLTKDGQELENSPGEPPANVRVTVKLPQGEPPPKQLFIGLQDSRNRLPGWETVNSAGEAHFKGQAPGKYSIVVSSSAKPFSVVRTLSQGLETRGRELNVTPGASLDLTVFLVGGVVTVEGFAKRGDKAMSGVMVILIPKDPEAHLDRFRRDQSDLDGSFAVRGVIPGTYTIVAVEDAWGFPWLQPGVLAHYIQHGQDLTIGEGMRGSVHLPDPVEVQPR